MLESDSFASNAVRLSGRAWLATGVLVLVALVGTPRVWTWVEPFDPPADHRVPYERSEDYWTYSRLASHAAGLDQVLVIGDSVVWGEYVPPQETLSHYLSRVAGAERRNAPADQFINGGLNGSHPLALAGLVRYYAGAVHDARVVLHCNLLWMSSIDRDLQVDNEVPFNHPRLIPQFMPDIPAYSASVSDRMSTVFDRMLPFRAWVYHLRIACLGSQDLHYWSIRHPYANPLSAIARGLQAGEEDERRHMPVPWTERGITPEDLPWIDLENSLQWRAWQNTADVLLDRGNEVFVIVGPFNEHLLQQPSRARYRTLVEQATGWLRERQIPFAAPALLPSEEYADASHPLAVGYERLARTVFADEEFTRWLGQ